MFVYVEYVLIDNFIIDYYLLWSALALTGQKVKGWRIFLGACFGAVTALIMPFITDNNLILIPLKILVGVLMVVIAHKFNSLRGVYLHFLIFFLYTAIVGGAVIALFNLFGLEYSSEISIALMVFPVCITIKALSKALNFFMRKREQISNTVSVFLCKDDLRVSANGFFDTGNGVYYNGNPVVFCSKKVIKPFLANPIKLKPFYVEVQTINGSDKKFAFNIDQIKIYLRGEWNIFNNVTLCVIEDGVDGLYDLILHPKLMEESYEKNITKTKKVS